jgi:hypothetical protein
MKRKFTHKVIAVITYTAIGGLLTLAVSGIMMSIFWLITDPTFRV